MLSLYNTVCKKSMGADPNTQEAADAFAHGPVAKGSVDGVVGGRKRVKCLSWNRNFNTFAA